MTHSLAVRVDDAIFDAIGEASQEEGRGRSEIVREALELWLKRRRLEAKIRREVDGYRRFPVTPDEFEPLLRLQVWPK